MIKLISLLLLIFSMNTQAGNELILSREIVIDYQQPVKIGHFSNMLYIKYNSWDFSHELVNPKKIYETIDLTGMEHEYIRSLFDLSVRKQFPIWLNELSKEQAESFAINNDKYVHKNIASAELYGAFDEKSNKGNIFIIESSQIHHLTVSGEEEKFLNLINSIRSK